MVNNKERKGIINRRINKKSQKCN